MNEIKKSENKRIAVYMRYGNVDAKGQSVIDRQALLYTEFCKERYGSEFVIYTDNGRGRTEFYRLLADCRAGKIDRIITKCVSQISSFMIELLSLIRELKELGVAVFFEVENLDTLENDEMALAMFACLAEQESKKRSTAMKLSWASRKSWQAKKRGEITN